jgi:primosomal protein N' (replication factor Y) (superfamily II helicase)
MAERYVVPLSVAIGATHPARVASEEAGRGPVDAPKPVNQGWPQVLRGYEGGSTLTEACRSGTGTFAVRPLPSEEGSACLEAVAACLAGGRHAVVVVPEGEPLPATARLLADTFGDVALLYVGGEPRERYRSWLDMLAGRYGLVIGTRPSVFAPVARLGLVWVHREVHPGHREERAPRHHVRDVALARARLEDAVCVVSGLVPSAETAAAVDAGEIDVVRAARDRERSAAPLVETAGPARDGRSPRLARLLREARGAFLLASFQGFGVARVCRRCGEPARCRVCAGLLTVRGESTACAVCGAPGTCPVCGSTRFGVEPGGTEHLQGWASRVSRLPVDRVEAGEDAVAPGVGRVIVGTAAAVKDFGPVRVPVVAILDPDRARRRGGLAAPEQALATWSEAAAWAGPRGDGGRVLLQTAEPGDPAIQALVRWDPAPFLRSEHRRRRDAGFPPGHPVFRVVGSPELPDSLAALRPVNLLTSAAEGETVCLVTLQRDAVPGFRERAVRWAEDGTVARVEAEPQL